MHVFAYNSAYHLNALRKTDHTIKYSVNNYLIVTTNNIPHLANL